MKERKEQDTEKACGAICMQKIEKRGDIWVAEESWSPSVPSETLNSHYTV